MAIVIDPVVNFVVGIYCYSVLFYDILHFFVSAFLIYVRGFYRAFVPKPKHSLTGELALVTGAGSGIGRELCLQLAKLQVAVICVDRNDDSNQLTAEMVRRNGGVAFCYTCDVSNREQVFNMSKQVVEDIGDVNILINNAGIRFVKPFEQFSMDEIENTINVNLFGTVWMTRAFLSRMMQINHGSIVSLSALAGYGGLPHMLPFTASKHGVKGFMEGLYMELRQDFPDHKIHLMTVAPFTVDTGVRKGTVITIPGLANVVTAEKAARIIIAGLQRRETVIFIPWIYFYIMSFLRILPLRVQLRITDFVDTGLDINYDVTSKTD